MKVNKILIVDDEPSNLAAMVDIFMKAGSMYEIFQSLTAKMAIEIAQKRLPDLIITDWEMPVKNGIEMIKELKQDSLTCDIPIIMCTGVMISSEHLQTALDAGAVDYIRKPVDEIELMARVRSMLVLSNSFKEIKALNSLKDKIFTIIGHDLRGPVGNIKSMVELIANQSINIEPNKIADFFTLLNRSAKSTYNLLENLLSWANTQQSKISFNPQMYSLERLINENIQIFEENAQFKKIAIKMNARGNTQVNMDINLISSVIRNLLSNATKFTSAVGTITIDIKTSSKAHIVSLSDTGVGIAPENIEKIMSKLEYFTTYGTNKEKGSGLGILLCLEFIAIHKGQLWVESEVGKGSTFYFSLPY